MGSKVPKIGKPNFIAIAGMIDEDVFGVREYYIVCLAKARAIKHKDTLDACIDWIVALTSEMRQRTPIAGSSHSAPDLPDGGTKDIHTMNRGELFRAREMQIVRLVEARRKHDSDATVACIDWISGLTAEMQLRNEDDAANKPLPGLPAPLAMQ